MLTCKEYSDLIKKQISEEVKQFEKKPKLVAIQFGDDPSCISYAKGREKDCVAVGFILETIKFPENIDNETVLRKIAEMNADDSINGIILQQPFPKLFDKKSIQNAISPEKDVDGFNINSSFEACTPLGVINYLEYHDYKFESKSACVVGRSEVVGKPLAKMLLDRNCTVTVCHSKSHKADLINATWSNIVFTCVNQAEIFNVDYFSFNSDIIDFGISVGKDGKLHGNIESKALQYLYEFNRDQYGKIVISGTGGTGLLTRVALLQNVLKAYKLQS